MIPIAIVAYPDSLKSAVYGLEEMFLLASRACRELGLEYDFAPRILRWPDDFTSNDTTHYAAVLLPPSQQRGFDLDPDTALVAWLQAQHKGGTILASACAGLFVLAGTGVLEQKQVTTHWGLQSLCEQRYPELNLNTNAILLNQGDLITAGGMMSWVDLGLELISQFSSPVVMRRVGKILLVDTGGREQRYYQSFSPDFRHGDQMVLSLQHYLNTEFVTVITIAALAERARLTERTLQRRFLKATGLSPNQYLQRVRVQKACDLLESTNHSFDWISRQVGYDDVSACRKVFSRVTGLSPGDFRKRFQ